MVVKADVFEPQRMFERGHRDRFGRVDDRGLAVKNIVHSIGRGDGLLNVAEFVREAPRGIAHAGEHGEEDTHIAMAEWDIANLDPENVGMLAEHEIAAHYGGDQD